MGNPYLSRNESIILATHRILTRSVSSDMILTNQRLILVDSNNPQFLPETLPLTTIETVLYGESASREPEITLSVTAAAGQGATVPMPLIFSERPGVSRISERDDWVKSLREQVTLVRERVISAGGAGEFPVPGEAGEASSPAAGQASISLSPGGLVEPSADQVFSGVELTPGLPMESPPGTMTDQSQVSVSPAGQSESPQGTPEGQSSLADRFHPAGSQSPGPRKSTILGIAIIVVLIIVLAGGMYLFANTLPGRTTVVPQTTPVQTAEMVATPTPIPTPADVTATPTVPDATVTVPTVEQIPVPKTGVWVHVLYDGNYSGTVGMSGRFRDVSGSGDHYFQIPAKDEIVSATIQKLDGSGNSLTVEIYSDGVMAASKTTKVPKGTADIHAMV